ncbi:MAG TPA: hypothetical protein VEY30_11720, partial [Myxococcaceae bacterium]|nr:hypothetical protein [Myxococcaceae bacterium]
MLPERPPEGTLRSRLPELSATGTRSWRPYAFKELEKVSRAQQLLVQRLEWLLPSASAAGRVVESIRDRLRDLFDTEVSFFLDYVHAIRPRDFKKYVADPTFLAIVAPAPHKTRGFLEVELGLAHATIDTLLGGAAEAAALRPLSDIDEGVMSFVVLEALRALAPNIEPGLPRMRLEGVARSSNEAVAVLGDEPQVAVLQFKAVLGPHAGFVRLFIPSTVVGMTNPPRDGAERRARRAEEMRQNLSRLQGVKTWLRAEIGTGEITNGDLAGLQSGDVVLIDGVSTRPDLGESGTASLRVGLGRVGRFQAEVAVADGRYQATVLGFEPGEEGRHGREPGDEEEEAAEALAEGGGQGDGGGYEDEDEEGAYEEEAPESNDDDEETTPGELSSKSEASERNEMSEGDVSVEGSELLNDIPLQIAVELSRVS